MQVKILEIRDSATMIPVLCVNMNVDPDLLDVDITTDDPAERIRERRRRAEAQRYYLNRLGYPMDGEPNIAITHLAMNGTPMWNDPYGWRDGARTYPVAHNYIYEHWEELRDGDVVDVEFILGERATPKVSERHTTDSGWTVRPAPHITGEPEPEDL